VRSGAVTDRPTSPSTPGETPPVPPAPPDPPSALVRGWAVTVGGLAVAKAVSLIEPSGLLAANLAGVAAFLFVAVPDARLRARGEGWEACGLPWAPGGLRSRGTWRAWGRGALVAAATCAVIFPLFAAVFWGFARALPSLPPGIAHALAPYGPPAGFRLRAPPGLAWQVPVQLLVVALPEELFYRGWMQSSWSRGRPGRGATVLGARLGAGFVATQALFALGHLVVWRPWRLGTFFPGLLFGWLRERTGSLAAPVLVHAASNLFLATLEASFYG
jgi:membrane protease YdiL (CAAX protease family)